MAKASIGSHGYFEREHYTSQPELFCDYNTVNIINHSVILSADQDSIYSFSLFLPTIISNLGYSSVKAQLFTVPPNMAGFFSVLLCSFLSDKVKGRGPIMIGCCSLAIIGYIMLLVKTRPLVHYGGFDVPNLSRWSILS